MPNGQKVILMDKKYLIIGGTGMLRKVVLELGRNSVILVTGRREERLKELAGNNPNIFIFSGDYTDAIFIENLQEEIKNFSGIFDVIAWVHQEGNKVHQEIFKLFNDQKSYRYYHVLSSKWGNPKIIHPAKVEARSFNNLDYRQVILGYMNDRGKKRWLSDEEISDGVMEALRAETSVYYVGISEN